MTIANAILISSCGLLAIYHFLKSFQWRLDRASLLGRVELANRLEASRVEQIAAAEAVIEAQKMLLQDASDMLGMYAIEDEPIDKNKAAAIALAVERVLNGSVADMLAVEKAFASSAAH
jgi:hypothetical protein